MRLMIGFIFAACFFMSPAYAKDAKAAPAAKKATAKVSKKTNKSAKGRHLAKSAAKSKKAKGKFRVRLLTFTQLAKLPKAKREKYVRDMRDLLVYIEGYQKQYEVASNPYLQKLKEQIAWMLDEVKVLPEAHAEPPEVRDAEARRAREERLRRLARGYPQHVGSGWTCGEGLAFDVWAGTCYLLNSAGSTRFAVAGTGTETCPTHLGYKEVAHTEAGSGSGGAWIQTLRACVPNASFDRLNAERQAAVTNGQRLPRGSFDGDLTPEQTALTNSGAGVSVDVAAAPVGVGTDAAVDTSVAAEAGVGTTVGVGTTAGVGTTEPLETEAVEGAAAGACTPPVLACKNLTPEARTAAISRFRSNGRTDDAVCVSGGFLSAYKGQRKVPGGCEVVRQLPYGERFGEHRPKCGAGRAMCNPVAFCMATEQTVNGAKMDVPMIYCVDVNRNNERNAPITETCNTEYTRMIAGTVRTGRDGKPVEGEIVEGMKGVVPKSCDAFAFKSLPIQEEWNKLVADTEKLVKNWCTDANPDLQALFCRECEILNEKIAAMNSAAGASNCSTTVAGAAPALTVPPEEGAGAVNEGAVDPDADVE